MSALAAGLGIAAAAFAARYGIQMYQKSALTGLARVYYRGGFEPVMSQREALLILGLRRNADTQKIRDAHRRIMIANHPDQGGSGYLAGKVNEAKDLLTGKGGSSGSGSGM